ncbi:MAG TPA: nuclear transport factor 2 family protein [Dehalococcoidia bacterium]|jgi:ketosteroid isomerase-like protein|nr:nuclear transport factor 2 family protein [Dehalococcoidia bacterium]
MPEESSAQQGAALASQAEGAEVLTQLQRAIAAHDLEAMAACFTPDYDSLFPTHPDRSFRGHDQMRRNWSQIFAAVPDLQADLVRCTADGDTVWAEWDWHGTRGDGLAHRMRGTTIQGIQGGQISWARLYMEPVEQGGRGSDAAVRQLIAETPTAP